MLSKKAKFHNYIFFPHFFYEYSLVLRIAASLVPLLRLVLALALLFLKMRLTTLVFNKHLLWVPIVWVRSTPIVLCIPKLKCWKCLEKCVFILERCVSNPSIIELSLF